MSGAGQGTRPLRVLMLNERDLGHPLAGGVEVHLEETGTRLARDHGIETTVLCAGFAGCTPEEARGGNGSPGGPQLPRHKRTVRYAYKAGNSSYVNL